MKTLLDKVEERLRVIDQMVTGTGCQNTVQPVLANISALVKQIAATHQDVQEDAARAQEELDMQKASKKLPTPSGQALVGPDVYHPEPEPQEPELEKAGHPSHYSSTPEPGTTFTGDKSFVDELNKPEHHAKKRR